MINHTELSPGWCDFYFFFIFLAAVVVVLDVVGLEPCVSLITPGTSWRIRWDNSSPSLSSHYPGLRVKIRAALCMCACFFFFFADDHSRFLNLRLSPKHENPEAFAGSNQGRFMPGASLCQRSLGDLCFMHRAANRAGFVVVLSSGTIWAGLQNRQGAVWEISAVRGCTDLQKQGEWPGVRPEHKQTTEMHEYALNQHDQQNRNNSCGKALLWFQLHWCRMQSHNLGGK